jgi:hypothetical protein
VIELKNNFKLLKNELGLIQKKLQVNYKWTTNELWMDHETMDGNSFEWNPFIMWPCPILVSVTSPPFLMMSSTNNDLGFAWISSMKFFHFLHGI